MIDSKLTLDEITEKISTYADLFQYLYMKGYKVSQESDVHFVVGGIDWFVTHTAEHVFESNTGNCGDGSNLVNYILKDDYDEQGYIHETYNDSGHIYNYFKEDGVYYFIDLIDLVTVVNSYDNADFRMGTGTDPKQISEYLVGEENQIGLLKDGSQIWMQCLFPCQGSHLAVGWNNLYFGGEGPELPYVYPESVADSMKILYKKDSFDDPRFELDPPKNRWPEGTK